RRAIVAAGARPAIVQRPCTPRCARLLHAMPRNDAHCGPHHFRGPTMAQARPQELPVSGADDTGKLLLRVGLGVLILLHGIAKIMSGPGFILGLMEKSGLPPVLGYAVYIGEVLAPLLLI